MPFNSLGATFANPYVSVAFGTAFQSLIQPSQRRRTKVTQLKYLDAGTAHTLTFLRPLGGLGLDPAAWGPLTAPYAQQRGNLVVAAVAGGGTSIKLNRDPGVYSVNFPVDGMGAPLTADNPTAANDWYAIETAQPGVFYFTKISAATVNSDGTCTITVSTAAPTGGIPAGARVFFFGITTDVDPLTGAAHPSFQGGTGSSEKSFDGSGDSLVQSVQLGQPMLFNSNNATATGALTVLGGVYAEA